MSHDKRSFLFLQGLASPFFTRLGDHLRATGANVHRINFCTGDAAYWGRRPAWAFDSTQHGLTDFLELRLHAYGISDIMLFGDQRPIHRPAIEIARAKGVRVHVFEEGYVRPNWITLERGGVNADSALPRDPNWYLGVNPALPNHGDGLAVRVPLPVRATQDIAYRLANTLNPVKYPGYRTHRPRPAIVEYAGWTRRFASQPVRSRSDSRLIHRILARRRPLFLLPLQLNGDAQIVQHSRFRNMGEVIDEVLTSFAQHAPPAAEILIKNHPLDTGLFHYRRHIARLAEELGLRERAHYVDHGYLPTLMEHAAGVVVVNSTVGLSALHQRRPTLALADAIYNMPGLTAQIPLDDFWREPTPPDPELLHAFRNTVIHATQVNGDYFTREGIARAVRGCDRMLGERSPLEDLFDRFGRPEIS